MSADSTWLPATPRAPSHDVGADQIRLGLGWEDVDLDQGVLRVRRAVSRVGGAVQLGPTRTASSRWQLRLPPATEDALRQHRARQRAQQTLMGERTVTEQAGLGRGHPHELRHSAASLLSAAGVPLEAVADVLGHVSTRVTSATYRHRTTPTVEAAAGPMEQMLGSPRHGSTSRAT